MLFLDGIVAPKLRKQGGLSQLCFFPLVINLGHNGKCRLVQQIVGGVDTQFQEERDVVLFQDSLWIG